MADDREWFPITDADRAAPREGEPIDVWVYATHRIADDPQWYYGIIKGKRWPTGAGSVSAPPRWIDVRALEWQPNVERINA